MGGRVFNSSRCEPVIICNTSGCIIKGTKNTEWKVVTKVTANKETLINKVVVEHFIRFLTQE